MSGDGHGGRLRAPQILVAHRGASAYAPEHTMAAYRLALDQGADFVEQDLGVTRDGVLICLHDPTLERTTDVEQVFPDRFRLVQGARRWFAADFTLDEIKRLDAGAWFGPDYAGERVATFQEAIDLVRGKAGLFPELKAPDLYRDRRHGHGAAGGGRAPKERPRPPGRRSAHARSSCSRSTRRRCRRWRAICRRSIAPSCSSLAARRAGHPMPDSARSRPSRRAWDPSKPLIESDVTLVGRAHAAGLTVIPYTFRSSSAGRFPSVRDEMAHFLTVVGVDGLFTDNPDLFPR